MIRLVGLVSSAEGQKQNLRFPRRGRNSASRRLHPWLLEFPACQCTPNRCQTRQPPQLHEPNPYNKSLQWVPHWSVSAEPDWHSKARPHHAGFQWTLSSGRTGRSLCSREDQHREDATLLHFPNIPDVRAGIGGPVDICVIAQTRRAELPAPHWSTPASPFPIQDALSAGSQAGGSAVRSSWAVPSGRAPPRIQEEDGDVDKVASLGSSHQSVSWFAPKAGTASNEPRMGHL